MALETYHEQTQERWDPAKECGEEDPWFFSCTNPRGRERERERVGERYIHIYIHEEEELSSSILLLNKSD
jgi:hypothetical protein